MLLASNLIHVGLPYISSFLPSEKKGFWGKDIRDPWPSEIPLNPNPTQRDIREAEEDLLLVAKDLTWCVNDMMYPKWGYLGLTRLAETEEPWEVLGCDTIMASDKMLKSRGDQRRPLVIGIMQEYVTALRGSDPKSEPHIRATFMAGITMAHEVVHAIFQNDFRPFHPQKEPYVGDDCEAEIGASFISWIFSGFHPQHSTGDEKFINTLYWEPQYTLSMCERPLYRTYYSIPISYLERLLSQQFWDSLGSPDQPHFSKSARKELRPDTDEKSGRVAIGRKPNWTFSFLRQRPLWNEDNYFRMPGFKERDKIKGLSLEEIEYERELIKDHPQNRRYAAMSKEERDNRYRHMRFLKTDPVGPYTDDSDSCEETNSKPPKFSKLKNSKPPKQKRQKQKPDWNDFEDELRCPPPKSPQLVDLTIEKGANHKSIIKMSQNGPNFLDLTGEAANQLLAITQVSPKRPKFIDLTTEEGANQRQTIRKISSKRPGIVDLTIDEAANQISTITKMSEELAARAAEIDALVYEPGAGPRKRRKYGSHIMEEIEDYEEIIDLEKTLENQHLLSEGKPRRLNRRRAANPPPQAPPSHMQDIYDQISSQDGRDVWWSE
jgi:hypothetical protein